MPYSPYVDSSTNQLSKIFRPDGSWTEKVKQTIKVIEEGDYTYVCKTAVSQLDNTTEPVWQIMRIYSVGSETNIGYADGNILYDNILTEYNSKYYS